MIGPDAFAPQGENIRALIRQARQDQLPHAALISGDAGVGKWSLARALAAAMLCKAEDSGTRPCGRCKSCQEMEAGTHPDLIVIRKGEPLVRTDTKTAIPVSDISEMIRQVNLRGFQGSKRIVIIRRAEDMTVEAQNKMLKTLEEPPEGVYFFLTAVSADKLLPTIVSRCRPIHMHLWGEEDLRRMLAEHGISGQRALDAAAEAQGSIGQAIVLAGDDAYWAFRKEVTEDFLCCPNRSEILRVSGKWKDRKEEAEAIFRVMDSFFSRVSHRALGLEKGKGEPLPAPWQAFSEKASPADLVRVGDAVSLARTRILNSVQFQPVMEQLILTLMEASSI